MNSGVVYEPLAVVATPARAEPSDGDGLEHDGMHAERGYRPAATLSGVTVEQHRVAEREEAVVVGRAPRRRARRQRSPTKASIIISSVVRGRWKLVISRSTTCQS